jgi:hypothetical protein
VTDTPREDGETQIVGIVGAGPAGLAAAWELARHGRRAVVWEMDDCVGGISRTVEYDGFRFDLGGHRFFTKVEEVEKVWDEILGDEMLDRPACRASSTAAISSTIRCARSTRSRDSARSKRRAAWRASPAPACCPSATSATSSNGCRTGSAAASSRSSSRPTPRRSGGCRAAKSAPTGRRSASRT